jgi:hypothetical protein
LAVAAGDPHGQQGNANVIICVLDAPRAYNFWPCGYPRNMTPNFDRLARA